MEVSVFGCEAYALVPKDDRRKLEPRSRKCVFLGYGPDDEIRYRLGDPEQRQIVRCSDVVFNESAMHKTAERPIEVRADQFGLLLSDPADSDETDLSENLLFIPVFFR